MEHPRRRSTPRRGCRSPRAARAALEHFLEAHPRGKAGQVIYDLKGDFGVDPGLLRERFGFYFDRFEVRAEKAG